MELNHLLICWVIWVLLTTHPAVCDFSCESLKTLLSLQTTAASQFSGDNWEGNPLWNPYPGRNWTENSAFLLCVVVLVVEMCCASPPSSWEPLWSQLFLLHTGNLGFGQGLGSWVAVSRDSGWYPCGQLNLLLGPWSLPENTPEAHTSHTHSQGLCLFSAQGQCLKSLKKLFLGF